MDDRHAQFLIVVADACRGAGTGELIVEVLTIDGVRYCGVPIAVEDGQPDDADGGTLHIGGRVVALEEVVEFVLRPAREGSGPPVASLDPSKARTSFRLRKR